MSKSKKHADGGIFSKRGTHVVRLPTVAVISMLVIIVGLTILLWSAERGRTTHLLMKRPGDLSALSPSLVGLAQGSLDGGNQIELLQNGDGFFPRLLADVAAAKQSIHIESY